MNEWRSTGPEAAFNVGERAEENNSLAHVLGIATGNPKRVVQQEDFAEEFLETLEGCSPSMKEMAKRINKVSGIRTRYLAYYCDDYAKNPKLMTHGAPSLNDRLEMFEAASVKLGHEVAEKTLADWGGDKSKITHVVTFSCSGMICPGLDLRLIKSLGLSQKTKHMFVSYMGCHGGLVGMRMASEIAKADPSHRVLIVCLELSSVNAHAPDPSNPMNNIIISILFGDGAAGMVVGSHPTNYERVIYEIHQTNSTYIPNSETAIMARPSEQGEIATVGKEVPSLVVGAVDPFVRELVGDHLDYEKDLLWAVHPGGKAILDATQRGCRLSPAKMEASRDILRRYGNMASATILFVLDQMRRDNVKAAAKQWTVALAFGPGVCVEGSLLRLVN